MNGVYETFARGLSLTQFPAIEQGRRLHSCGAEIAGPYRTPSAGDQHSLAAQVTHDYLQYERYPDALSKNIYLTALHDRNEVLFYRLLSENLREMIPIVDDFTVGMAMAQYHHECRPPQGVCLSINHAGEIQEAFSNFGMCPNDVDLILATDAEQVLGVGDWGVGGVEVAISKLAIYTAAGGIDPTRVIPVILDVGTNRESLLKDPTHIGNWHARIRGQQYDDVVDEYVNVATRLCSNALLQWNDFAPENGRRILEQYRDRIGTFNDDIQRTGAITLAAVISAVRACGTTLRNHRVVIFGAGTAGIGITDRIRNAMVREGLSKSEAAKRFWCVDRQGLLTADMLGEQRIYQVSYARPTDDNGDWQHGEGGGDLSVAEVAGRVKPTMLIGVSTASGSFTEAIIRDMAAHTDRPIVFSLSNPPVRAEAKPSDLIAWTDGRALIATGSPSAPVTHKGVTHVVAELNNSMLYPGLGLGVVVSKACRVSEGMLFAAASAVSSLVTVRQPGASLLPSIDNLRSVLATVAVAVAEAADAEGLARVRLDDVVQQVQDAMWQPEYRHAVAV